MLTWSGSLPIKVETLHATNSSNNAIINLVIVYKRHLYFKGEVVSENGTKMLNVRKKLDEVWEDHRKAEKTQEQPPRI